MRKEKKAQCCNQARNVQLHSLVWFFGHFSNPVHKSTSVGVLSAGVVPKNFRTRVRHSMEKLGAPYEVIFVDDGSETIECFPCRSIWPLHPSPCSAKEGSNSAKTKGMIMMTRRQAIRSATLATATIWVSGGLRTALAQGQASSSTSAPAGPFKLPDLPYPYDALEPHIDAQTMTIHHDKHHAAYVTNLNKAVAD